MSVFTHFNEDGNAVMVDVGAKAETKREALASGVICMSEECFQKVKEGSMKKGDVLGVARIAGIMGAKKTAEEAGAQFIDVDIAPFQEACQPVIDNVTMKSEGAKALYEEIRSLAN